MDEQKNQNKAARWVEISLFAVAIALVALVLWSFSMNKKIVQKLSLRETQVSSLIEELGEVREENLFLQEKFGHQAKNIDNLAVKLKGIAEEMKDAEESHEGVEEEKIRRSASSELPLNTQQSNPLLDSFESNRTLRVLIAGHHQKLADTIILASFNRDEKKVKLVSIPRDLAIQGRKLNEYYSSYGAFEFLKYVEVLTNLSIDHYVILSMEAFQKLIDALGGVDVNVEKPLYDALFPKDRETYQIFSVEAGLHHFDGEEALKYARSRTGNSDFDRASRQQKIIKAVYEKARDLNLFQDLSLVKKMYDSAGSLVETNLGLLDMLLIMEQFQNSSFEEGFVLSTANFLTPTRNLKGQYILLPRNGDFTEIQQFFASL